ncbi:serine--tRNA ligase [Candidatus Bathyarchaeota archaeon]|nr:serine--tRNA ligase [Candidatus Bathyarchaeota archaeon]
MQDIKHIREQPEKVRENLARRHDPEKLELLDHVIETDKTWRELTQRVNDLRRRRNQISSEIGKVMKEGGDASSLRKEASEIPSRLRGLESQMSESQERLRDGLMRLPNMLHESVPYGEDEHDNVEVKRWGEKPDFGFKPKSHAEIVTALGIGDFERGAKAAGSGFYYLRNELALLDKAIQRYAINHLIKKGYSLIVPPYMIRRAAYEGVTDLADFESVMYKVEDEDEYLIATSEHPIGAMYIDEIIDEDILPLKYVGLSTNFRREVGAHGLDTKGLFRMHQFNKVEQFVFCCPEDSWHFHEELIGNAEALYQMLKIPYRIVNDCTGDIGTVAAKKYDLEAWSPRQNKYVEVVSCSNCTDYQARRLNIRCGKVGGEKRILHTLNSTAIATSRTLVAILESYQNADGTVTVPEVLRPYMNNLETIEPKIQ